MGDTANQFDVGGDLQLRNPAPTTEPGLASYKKAEIGLSVSFKPSPSQCLNRGGARNHPAAPTQNTLSLVEIFARLIVCFERKHIILRCIIDYANMFSLSKAKRSCILAVDESRPVVSIFVNIVSSGHRTIAMETTMREVNDLRIKGLVYTRTPQQLKSIESNRDMIWNWLEDAFKQIQFVLEDFHRGILNKFGPHDENLGVFEDLRLQAIIFSKSSPESHHQLHTILRKLLESVDLSIKATSTISRSLLSTQIHRGVRKRDKSDYKFGPGEVERSEFDARRSLLRTFWSSNGDREMEDVMKKFLDVVYKIRPSLEALESSVHLVNELEAERLELEQALVKQPEHQDFVKEAPHADDSGEMPETDPRISMGIRKLFSPCTPFKDKEEANFLRHRDIRSKRLVGTCDWLVNNYLFMDWLTKPPPQALWCWGLPGTGKSMSTARVVDILFKHNRNHAYYHLGNGKVESARGILLSLLGQLCRGHKNPLKRLDALLDKDTRPRNTEVAQIYDGTHEFGEAHPSTSIELLEGPPSQSPYVPEISGSSLGETMLPYPSESGNRQTSLNASSETHDLGSSQDLVHLAKLAEGIFQESSDLCEVKDPRAAPLEQSQMLDALCKMFLFVCQELKEVTLVIDGWDEARMDSKTDFEGMLRHFHEAKVKLYITSRSEPGSGVPFETKEVQTGPEINSSDIFEVILHALREKFEAVAWPTTKQIDVRLARIIVQKSYGIFALAKTQLKILLKDNFSVYSTPDDLVQMALELPTKKQMILEKGLRSLESGLDNISQLSKTILIWIIYSNWPISERALEEAIFKLGNNLVGTTEHEFGNIKYSDVINHLDPFLVVDKGNLLVHLASEQIKDAAGHVWPSPIESLFAVAKTEINYLLGDEFASGCRETKESLQGLLTNHPFLAQTCHSWAHLVRLSSELTQDSPQHSRRVVQIVQSPRPNSLIDARFNRHDLRGPPLSPTASIRKERRASSTDFLKGIELQENKLSISRFESKSKDAGNKVDYTEASFVTVVARPDQSIAGTMPASIKSRLVRPRDRQRELIRSLEGPDNLQKLSRKLCRSINIRLVIQVLLYTDPDFSSLGLTWRETTEWIMSMKTLQIAARFGLFSLVTDILMFEHSPVNELDKNGFTPLHEASIAGVNKVVDFLLDNGASTTAIDKFGKMPIHYARDHGHREIFVKLFERICEDFDGDIESIQTLVSHYASLIVGTTEDDRRVKELTLARSIEQGKTSVVILLLRTGVNPSCKTQQGLPVLHVAAQKNNLNILEMLLQYGADVSAVSSNDRASALHVAAKKGSLEAIKVLVMTGADPSAVDGHERTVLFPLLDAGEGMLKSKESEVDDSINQTVLFLLRRGVDPMRQDADGMQFIHRAASKGKLELCLILRDWGVNIDIQDRHGKTPADYAKASGFEDLAHRLSEWSS